MNSGKPQYNALPQFTDSDSDIDIFNAKGRYHPSTSPQKKPGFSGWKYLACITFFLVTIVIVAACFVLVNYKRHTDHGKILLKRASVKTSIGFIKGTEEILNSKKTHNFMGIPYAEPPVGKQRWRPPIAKKLMSDVYKADSNKRICMQYQGMPSKTKEESENCLYLNVITPTLNSSASLPVFVWIHGGYLINGYGDMPGYFPDSEFVADMNVVGVSIQYRLNAFGFLTLEELWEDGSYGNYGLMDQILALKWIKKNIQQFGGNPNLVTVSGQSSGGTSIFALVASPSAKGLFQRGIPMSGSPNFPLNYTITADNNKMFLNKSECHFFESAEEKRNCLYRLSSKEVINIIPKFPSWDFGDLIDFPTFGRIDGSLLPVDPVTMLVKPKDAYLIENSTSKVDLLVGSTAQEPGIAPVEHFKSITELRTFFGKRLKEFGVSISDVIQAYGKGNVTTYVNGSIDAQFLYETIVTDVRCSCPTTRLVKDFLQSPHLAGTYRYIFAWKPEKPINIFSGISIHNAAHGLDAFALFGFKNIENISPAQKEIVTTIRRVFKTFMVNGTVGGAMPGETIIFNGDSEAENIKGDYHEEQCDMWNKPSNGFLPYAWIN